MANSASSWISSLIVVRKRPTFTQLLAFMAEVGLVAALLAVTPGCSPIAENDAGQSVAETFDPETVVRDYDGIALEVLDVSERNMEGRNVLTVTLSVPLDPAKPFRSWFGVSEPDDSTPDGDWVLSASGRMASFVGSQPGTMYNVMVREGLTAANGSELATNHTARVKTRSKSSGAQFANTGSYLREGTGLPVTAVNVDRVHIDFYRLRDDAGPGSWNESQFELVHSAGFDIDAPENARVQRSIRLDDIEALDRPGVYWAVMRATDPQKVEKDWQYGTLTRTSVTWFSRTDIGLHLRDYGRNATVYAHSLRDGKPLRDVVVEMPGAGDMEGLAATSTDADGMVGLDGGIVGKKRLLAQYEGQRSHIDPRRPALDLSEFDTGERRHAPIDVFLYAPRDLFRPGEVIDFSALVRDDDGRTIPRSPTLEASIRRPDGSTVKTFQWWPMERGFYHRRWQVPEDESTGDWTLRIGDPLESPVEYRFKVEEFVPERMTLALGPDTDDRRLVAAPQDALRLKVRGNYLYGAPATGNVVETRLTVKPTRHPLTSLPDYEFGPVDAERSNTFSLKLKPVRLDHAGEGVLAVRSRWADVRIPLEARFVASLYESGGRPVTRSHSVLISSDTGMIGIRPWFGDANPAANSRVRFDIVNASPDGELMEAAELDAKLVKEDREYFWVDRGGRGWDYESSGSEYVTVARKVRIEAGKAATVDFPVETGHYRLEVRNPRDGQLASLRFHAGEDWYANWKAVQDGGVAPRPDKVTLTLDQPRYRAGDTAKLHVLPPQAGQALILVEADGPLWSRQLEVPAEGAEVEIPVARDWRRHDLYVSALVLHPDGGEQARSFGLAHLPLDREGRRLEVTIETPPKVVPMTRVETKVRIHQDGGAASGAHLTLAAVDTGVLNITGFETPDPHEAFFGQRRYAVEIRDLYDRLIEDIDAPAAKHRYGGDADSVESNLPEPDKRVVSLFSGPVQADAEGLATVVLDIPDFDGRLRLMAVAFTDDAFGQTERELVIASPIVAQLSMPRFLARGDQSVVALDLHNLSGEQRTVSAELHMMQGGSKTPTPLVAEPAQREVTLEDGERKVLRYPVKAEAYAGEAHIDLRLEGKGIHPIIRRWALPLRSPWPAVKRRRQALLPPGESFAAIREDVAGLIPSTINGRIMLSPNPEIDLVRHFDELLQYPYGCLEQTASRTFPLVYATPDRQTEYALARLDESRRFEMIQAGIDRISGMQRSGGGFGLWTRHSDEEHWLTAFTADLLMEAREAGAEVPDALIDSVMKRLIEYLHRDERFNDERWSASPAHYNFAYKAYAAFVLARVNQAPLGSLRTLFDHESKRAKTGLPLLHLGAALRRMGDLERGAKAIRLGIESLTSELHDGSVLGDYGSDIRDLALGIHLLITEVKAHDSAVELAIILADRLKTRQWLSTQERNALFMAGIALESVAGQSWQAELALAGAVTALNQTGRWNRSLTASELSGGVSVHSSNDRPLFAALAVEGQADQPPEPLAQGLAVHSAWYDLSGNAVAPDQVETGELFIVKLTVKADQRTPDALLVALLSAGFELENQNLPHSVDIETFSVAGRSLREWRDEARVKHVEYRDDRFVAAFDALRSADSELFYLARAVTPGVYRVPPPMVEDMYRPELRAMGDTPNAIVVEMGDEFR